MEENRPTQTGEEDWPQEEDVHAPAAYESAVAYERDNFHRPSTAHRHADDAHEPGNHHRHASAPSAEEPSRASEFTPKPRTSEVTSTPRTPRHQGAYVRKPRPRHTQPPVDDIQLDDEIGRGYAYDSSYTVSTLSPLRKGAYRRARSSEAKVRQELKYGQYLSVPKGNREIFSTHNRARTRHLVAIAAVVAALLVLILLFWPK